MKKTGSCQRCKAEMLMTSNTRKYCDACKKLVARVQSTETSRRLRAKAKAEGHSPKPRIKTREQQAKNTADLYAEKVLQEAAHYEAWGQYDDSPYPSWRGKTKRNKGFGA